MNSNLTFKKLSEKVVYSGYRVIVSKEFELPDGSIAKHEIVQSKAEVVVVVAFDTDQNLILVKQFRPGIEKIIIEFPGGRAEEGESLIDSAKRELEEETGYITDDIIEVGSYHGDSVSDTIYHAFLAKNCRKASKQNLDETEFIEVMIISKLEYEKYFKENRLSAINLLSYFLVKPYI
jgi:ADP-ribose pyrophosphatase